MTLHILLVEDDAAVREVLALPLQKAGFTVTEAPDVKQAREAMLLRQPDLILLDWMLPDISGVEWARTLKEAPHTRGVPIIMLTARGEEEDRVRGLEFGADDYVTKPFSPRELIARIRAVLRRTAPTSSDEPVEVDGLRLDPVSHPCYRQRQNRGDGANRVPAAAFLHDAPGQGVHPGTVTR
jgi:two-component system, OmpR family, phosphate regulon response regulator PhoB